MIDGGNNRRTGAPICDVECAPTYVYRILPLITIAAAALFFIVLTLSLICSSDVNSTDGWCCVTTDQCVFSIVAYAIIVTISMWNLSCCTQGSSLTVPVATLTLKRKLQLCAQLAVIVTAGIALIVIASMFIGYFAPSEFHCAADGISAFAIYSSLPMTFILASPLFCGLRMLRAAMLNQWMNGGNRRQRSNDNLVADRDSVPLNQIHSLRVIRLDSASSTAAASTSASIESSTTSLSTSSTTYALDELVFPAEPVPLTEICCTYGCSSCPICLEEYAPPVFVMVLPCGHTAHADCIIPWLKQHKTCAVCRKSFDVDLEHA